jgi:hypothetical protein
MEMVGTGSAEFEPADHAARAFDDLPNMSA